MKHLQKAYSQAITSSKLFRVKNVDRIVLLLFIFLMSLQCSYGQFNAEIDAKDAINEKLKKG